MCEKLKFTAYLQSKSTLLWILPNVQDRRPAVDTRVHEQHDGYEQSEHVNSVYVWNFIDIFMYFKNTGKNYGKIQSKSK